MRSASITEDRRWETAIVVLASDSRFSAIRTLPSVFWSSALVASSRRTIGAGRRKARAMAMRCFWPPESCAPFGPTAASPRSADQVGDLGGLGGGPDLLLRGVGADIADVVVDRAVEDDDVLRHDRERAAQRLDADVAHGGSADQDVAAVDLVEPGEKAEDGGLAGPRRAHDGRDLAPPERHVHAPEQRLLRRIAEDHVLQDQIALRIEIVGRARCVEDRGFLVVEAPDAREQDQAGLERDEELRHPATRIEDEDEADQEGDDPGTVDVEIGAQHHVSAAADHQHVDEGRGQIDIGQDHGLRGLELDRQRSLISVVERTRRSCSTCSWPEILTVRMPFTTSSIPSM